MLDSSLEQFGKTYGGFFLAEYDDTPFGSFWELVVICGLVWNREPTLKDVLLGLFTAPSAETDVGKVLCAWAWGLWPCEHCPWACVQGVPRELSPTHSQAFCSVMVVMGGGGVFLVRMGLGPTQLPKGEAGSLKPDQGCIRTSYHMRRRRGGVPPPHPDPPPPTQISQWESVKFYKRNY